MLSENKTIEERSVNTIRTLAIDAIQKANSGHPGIVMGCAPLAYLLYKKIMKHNPADPAWINRDRFILSAGHGSMLLYGILHLCGYDISLDDIKNFRQWGSITPGHPESGLTPGIETTTGPLGQGFANAVGMAIAEKNMGSRYNSEKYKILDHKIYCLASEGDMMEGVSHEAASLASHFGLDNLIVFFDSNNITIDGDLSFTMSEDVKKRFEAYKWNVARVDNINDTDALEKAVVSAKENAGKPTLIILKTTIGYGSPNKGGKSSSHGAPLGVDEVEATKKNLSWDTKESFFIPADVREHLLAAKETGAAYQASWEKLYKKWSAEFPEKAAELKNIISGEKDFSFMDQFPRFNDYSKSIATRSASGKIIEFIADYYPEFIGGSADLAASNKVKISDSGAFSSGDYSGRNIYFGIREHAMGSIANGISLYNNCRAFCATFLVFSDYMRPAIRIAAMTGLNPVYIFTHDSIGLGEDGPTHQPIEHISQLRSLPGMTVIRPADANETILAWKAALENHEGPTALMLSRQNLPVIDRNKYAPAEGLLKGAYILYEPEKEPKHLIISSGAEIDISLQAAETLSAEGIPTRVVNMGSMEIFEKQPEDYKDKVIPPEISSRLIVEAGLKCGWEKYIGCCGEAVTIDTFGASAPKEVLFEKFGFTAENLVERSRKIISKM